MQRPNFDTIRAGVNKGVSTATAMGYVKSCENYIIYLETGGYVDLPAKVAETPTSTKAFARGGADTPVDVHLVSHALVALAERVAALETKLAPAVE